MVKFFPIALTKPIFWGGFGVKIRFLLLAIEVQTELWIYFDSNAWPKKSQIFIPFCCIVSNEIEVFRFQLYHCKRPIKSLCNWLCSSNISPTDKCGSNTGTSKFEPSSLNLYLIICMDCKWRQNSTQNIWISKVSWKKGFGINLWKCTYITKLNETDLGLF